MGQHWGFCSSKKTLPFLERDYVPAELARVDRMPTAALLAAYPRCGRVPLTFINNRAVSGHGGAVFDGRHDNRTECSLGFPEGPSPAYQAIFSNNSAGGAGGAVFFDGPYLPQTCREVFGGRIGLPSRAVKVLFSGNQAEAWGDNIATRPVMIQLAGGVYEYTPGIDPLNLTAELYDSLKQLVKGSGSLINPYLIMALHCAPGQPCSARSSFEQAAYYSCDQSGRCRTAWGSVQCRVNQSKVAVVLSFDGLSSVEVTVECRPCQQGQHVAHKPVLGGTGVLAWACNTCGEGMTVVDPNDFRYGCVPCPAGTICPGGASPLFDVAAADITLKLLGGYQSAVPNTLSTAVGSALSSVLPLASPYVILTGSDACATDTGCIESRRAGQLTLTFQVILPLSLAGGISQFVNTQSWGRNLTFLMTRLGFDLTMVRAQAAVSARYPAIGQWQAVQGAYRLQGCRAGYLVVNSTSSQQNCVECPAGSYSLDPSDGCRDGVCDWRSCTACPTGASCASLSGGGDSESWTSFVPRVLQSSLGPVPAVALVLPNQTYTLFYSPDADRYVWTDESLNLRKASRQYVWEYLRECVSRASPCDADSAPSFLLRACPQGHALENSSLGIFRQQLQNCVPCLAGQYINDPLLPPCVDCPLGGRCSAGVFWPLIDGSIWEQDGRYSRILSCPVGYILVRSLSWFSYF